MKKLSKILTSEKYLNGRFFGDGVVRRTVLDPCLNCGKETIFTLKLIPTNRDNPFWPKYIPHIKETCANCGRYIRFAPQTPELIQKFNKLLEGASIDG